MTVRPVIIYSDHRVSIDGRAMPLCFRQDNGQAELWIPDDKVFGSKFKSLPLSRSFYRNTLEDLKQLHKEIRSAARKNGLLRRAGC